jgi:hypothetical protein
MKSNLCDKAQRADEGLIEIVMVRDKEQKMSDGILL